MSEIDVSKVVGYEFKPYRVSYNRRDLILYALGVGAKDLKFVYEGDQGFCALPTFPVVLDFKGTSSDIAPFGSRFAEIPGLSINPAMILHGEQSVEQLRPLPVEGEFVLKGKVLAVYDKGKGAVLVTENVLVDDKGTPYTRLTSSIFIRGAGGFGGDRGPSGAGNEPPKRAPDAIHAEATLDSQALLYRLSGDYNPLHADPGMASMVGFEKPILHGLCSFGFATRAVLAKFCNNDTSLFKSIAVRFSSPVFPGETLVTEMWKEGNKVLLQLRVKERNVIAISNAVVELKGTGAEAPTSPTNVQLKSAPVFEAMKVAIAKHPELVQKINAVYLFNITHGNQTVTYLLDLKNGKGGVTSPAPENARADCTLTISDEHYFDMSQGKLNPQNAFMQGKLKVKGNMMLAQKLGLIQQAASKL